MSLLINSISSSPKAVLALKPLSHKHMVHELCKIENFIETYFSDECVCTQKSRS